MICSFLNGMFKNFLNTINCFIASEYITLFPRWQKCLPISFFFFFLYFKKWIFFIFSSIIPDTTIVDVLQIFPDYVLSTLRMFYWQIFFPAIPNFCILTRSKNFTNLVTIRKVWFNNTLKSNTIKCKKLATVVSGWKYVTRLFVRKKQLNMSAEM